LTADADQRSPVLIAECSAWVPGTRVGDRRPGGRPSPPIRPWPAAVPCPRSYSLHPLPDKTRSADVAPGRRRLTTSRRGTSCPPVGHRSRPNATRMMPARTSSSMNWSTDGAGRADDHRGPHGGECEILSTSMAPRAQAPASAAAHPPAPIRATAVNPTSAEHDVAAEHVAGLGQRQGPCPRRSAPCWPPAVGTAGEVVSARPRRGWPARAGWSRWPATSTVRGPLRERPIAATASASALSVGSAPRGSRCGHRRLNRGRCLRRRRCGRRAAPCGAGPASAPITDRGFVEQRAPRGAPAVSASRVPGRRRFPPHRSQPVSCGRRRSWRPARGRTGGLRARR
jgi:hypothetical protein